MVFAYAVPPEIRIVPNPLSIVTMSLEVGTASPLQFAASNQLCVTPSPSQTFRNAHPRQAPVPVFSDPFGPIVIVPPTFKVKSLLDVESVWLTVRFPVVSMTMSWYDVSGRSRVMPPSPA